MTPISEKADYPGQCRHTWTPPRTREQKCSACGATCTRGESGAIVVYAAGAQATLLMEIDRTRGARESEG